MFWVEDIEKKLKEYFEKEYREVKDLIERNPKWLNSPRECVENSIQRCYGVSEFVQGLDVEYSVVELLYTEVRDKLEKLLEKD